MRRVHKRALPELEANPNLHLKKLYEFKHHVKRYYTGEEQEFLLEGVDRKIDEVHSKIKKEQESSNE